MRCYAMRCDAMRCDTMRCDAMLCDAMRCDAVRCSAEEVMQKVHAVKRRSNVYPAVVRWAGRPWRHIGRFKRKRRTRSSTRHAYYRTHAPTTIHQPNEWTKQVFLFVCVCARTRDAGAPRNVVGERRRGLFVHKTDHASRTKREPVVKENA